MVHMALFLYNIMESVLISSLISAAIVHGQSFFCKL